MVNESPDEKVLEHKRTETGSRRNYSKRMTTGGGRANKSSGKKTALHSCWKDDPKIIKGLGGLFELPRQEEKKKSRRRGQRGIEALPVLLSVVRYTKNVAKQRKSRLTKKQIREKVNPGAV